MAKESNSSHTNLYLSALIVNIVYFGAGASNVWSSPAIPRLKDPTAKFYSGELDEKWLVSCFAVGNVFGPLVSGVFMDTLGRRAATFLIILFLLVSYSLLGIAPSVEVLYLARIIGGLSFGMSVSVLPVYVAEISDAKLRGSLNSLPLASRSLGYFAMYAVGPFVNYLHLVMVSLAAPLLALVLFFRLPESPYHLLAKGRSDQAQDTLSWLRGGTGAVTDAVLAELNIIQRSVEEMQATKKGLGDLFTSRASLRALYLSCGLLFFLQMSGTPLILSTTETLFRQARVDVSAQVCTLVFGGLMLIVGLLGPTVTKHFGYKRPLVVSALGMSLSLVVFGCHFYLIHIGADMSSFRLLPLVSLAAYISFYSLGFSNSAFAVVGELFAPNVKALGTSLANSIGFACALLSIQMYYLVKEAAGIHWGVWCFALTNALAVLFTCLCVPDTSGLSLEHIQELLARPWPCSGRSNKVVPVERYTVRYDKEVF